MGWGSQCVALGCAEGFGRGRHAARAALHLVVQWEIERGWQEADARHARMLQDAQRQLLDTVAAACALPPKKARRDHGDS